MDADPRNSLFESSLEQLPTKAISPSTAVTPGPYAQPSPIGGALLDDIDARAWMQNKYMVGGATALVSLIILSASGPSFLMNEDSLDFQILLVLGALIFVAVVWGPNLYAMAKAARARSL